MGKPGSGGGGTKTNFDQSLFGPPPGPLTLTTEAWVQIAAIPTGSRLWLGNARLTSPDKSLSFNFRTNNIGSSSGTLNTTSSLYSASVSSTKGTVNVDMYKSGRLHIATVVGTGSEKLWLYIKGKGGSQASYLYDVYWTVE